MDLQDVEKVALCKYSLFIYNNLGHTDIMGEVWWPQGWCTHLWIERSGFDPLSGTLCCVLGQEYTTLTVPLSTQVYKWVPANLMLGVTLRWTSIPSRGSRNTPSGFILRKPG